VIVKVEPETVPGPLVTVKDTVNPEVELALNVIGDTPLATGVVGCVNVIVCAVVPVAAVAVPLNAKVCVEPLTFSMLSVTVPVPVREPVTVGAKEKEASQVEPADKDAPQLPAAAEKLIVAAKLDSVNAALPSLLTGTLCAALVAPTAVDTYVSAGGLANNISLTAL
jgi:hypothetical protein